MNIFSWQQQRPFPVNIPKDVQPKRNAGRSIHSFSQYSVGYVFIVEVQHFHQHFLLMFSIFLAACCYIQLTMWKISIKALFFMPFHLYRLLSPVWNHLNSHSRKRARTRISYALPGVAALSRWSPAFSDILDPVIQLSCNSPLQLLRK